MTVRTALIVVAFAVVTSTAHAQTPPVQAVLQAPPISQATFTFLTPASLQFHLFSTGWDSIATVPITADQLLRVFYRKADGVTVAILEDVYSNVLAQSRPFTLGINADVLNVTLLTQATTAPEWKATVVVFAYNRTTGLATRMALTWSALF